MNKENIYVQWIGFLNHVFTCIREDGWLSAEDEFIDKDPDQIERYPRVTQGLYYEFASDILGMCVDGHEHDVIQDYARCTIASLQRSPSIDYNEALIYCIWNSIDAFLRYDNPRLAAEFGRVSIPYDLRPKKDSFTQWIGQINKPEPVNDIEELYLRADAFIESIRC